MFKNLKINNKDLPGSEVGKPIKGDRLRMNRNRRSQRSFQVVEAPRKRTGWRREPERQLGRLWVQGVFWGLTSSQGCQRKDCSRLKAQPFNSALWGASLSLWRICEKTRML